MRIVEALPRPDYRMTLRFEGGESGEVDLSALAGQGIFSAWQQPGVFEQASINGHGALEWPGDIDLCPDSLYLQMTRERPEILFPALQGRLTNA
ncbi:MAG TPA: DUF2442 domain-containing protein [Bradyrhizobium sp.]|nr:DUF2442 domain-containing protein [Bradyrhizobium sp.]